MSETRKRRGRDDALVAMEPIYVDLDTAAMACALSTTSFKVLVRKGEAPQPRKLSPNRVGWLVRELRAWAEARPVSDLPPPVNCGARRQPEPQDAHQAE